VFENFRVSFSCGFIASGRLLLGDRGYSQRSNALLSHSKTTVPYWDKDKLKLSFSESGRVTGLTLKVEIGRKRLQASPRSNENIERENR